MKLEISTAATPRLDRRGWGWLITLSNKKNPAHPENPENPVQDKTPSDQKPSPESGEGWVGFITNSAAIYHFLFPP
ncbi:hypothetical protein [Adhaeribacter terreus]|uniref:Uncharacterized protein n=1 Tax=Adhaeribacter terreus TaxID=529703 RepID=A0ABW0E828_9BACT